MLIRDRSMLGSHVKGRILFYRLKTIAQKLLRHLQKLKRTPQSQII